MKAFSRNSKLASQRFAEGGKPTEAAHFSSCEGERFFSSHLEENTLSAISSVASCDPRVDKASVLRKENFDVLHESDKKRLSAVRWFKEHFDISREYDKRSLVSVGCFKENFDMSHESGKVRPSSVRCFKKTFGVSHESDNKTVSSFRRNFAISPQCGEGTVSPLTFVGTKSDCSRQETTGLNAHSFEAENQSGDDFFAVLSHRRDETWETTQVCMREHCGERLYGKEGTAFSRTSSGDLEFFLPTSVNKHEGEAPNSAMQKARQLREEISQVEMSRCLGGGDEETLVSRLKHETSVDLRPPRTEEKPKQLKASCVPGTCREEKERKHVSTSTPESHHPILVFPVPFHASLDAREVCERGGLASNRTEEEEKQLKKLLMSRNEALGRRVTVLKANLETKEATIAKLLARCRRREQELERVRAMLLPIVEENVKLAGEIDKRKQQTGGKDEYLAALRDAIKAHVASFLKGESEAPQDVRTAQGPRQGIERDRGRANVGLSRCLGSERESEERDRQEERVHGRRTKRAFVCGVFDETESDDGAGVPVAFRLDSRDSTSEEEGASEASEKPGGVQKRLPSSENKSKNPQRQWWWMDDKDDDCDTEVTRERSETKDGPSGTTSEFVAFLRGRKIVEETVQRRRQGRRDSFFSARRKVGFLEALVEKIQENPFSGSKRETHEWLMNWLVKQYRRTGSTPTESRSFAGSRATSREGNEEKEKRGTKEKMEEEERKRIGKCGVETELPGESDEEMEEEHTKAAHLLQPNAWWMCSAVAVHSQDV
ncbi:hypothetical protein TGVEG_301250 [Toxoplasma gondii VEG]|uniref:Uncharacterized protein n=3 Tax=Toxoplasma gondii TaxID=5811 RepID=V4YJJ4_TOXGV|nr:hypothetical protein TGVEG_301250 [Toxoplasma gondii VEG]KFG28262.1 hypothetical protein TGP89_301250 [Toxoplasma gondii p89]